MCLYFEIITHACLVSLWAWFFPYFFNKFIQEIRKVENPLGVWGNQLLLSRNQTEQLKNPNLVFSLFLSFHGFSFSKLPSEVMIFNGQRKGINVKVTADPNCNFSVWNLDSCTPCWITRIVFCALLEPSHSLIIRGLSRWRLIWVRFAYCMDRTLA